MEEKLISIIEKAADEKELATIIQKKRAPFSIYLEKKGHQPDARFLTTNQYFANESYLWAAIPISDLLPLIHKLQWGFFTLAALFLAGYIIMRAFLLHRFSSPIHKITQAIKPYQEGKEEYLPQIDLDASFNAYDEFGNLVATLNSLSAKIQYQIETLTYQKNEHESILNSLVEGVLAVNAQNIVTYANPVACQMLHTEKEDLIAKPLQSYGHKTVDLVEKCTDLIAKCQKESRMIHFSIILGRVKRRYLDIIAAPRAFKSGAVVVLQDKSSDFLMLEMGKEFIANASHELKTPITIIRGYAETLHDNKKLTKSMHQEITQKIVTTCERLNQLVQNLLTLADIDHLTNLHFRNTNLLLTVENCKHIMDELNKDVSIETSSDNEEYLVAADSHLLELAITNLLDNAIKYSNLPTTIYVSLQEKNDKVILTISDQGIGIPKQDLQHIFDRFYTVDKARSRKYGGTGLGLSLVKTIIEKHKAEISVDSIVGQGTTFTLTFPLVKVTSCVVT